MESILQKIQKKIADPDFQYSRLIVDPDFQYIGPSMAIIMIFDAIKSGYRLCKVEELKTDIRERFKVEIDKSCEESVGGFDLIELSADIQSIIREKMK